VVAFTAAAILEILGCFTFWLWLRRGASPAIAALGILSLIGFAVALTRVDVAFAGRAYAAYGGIQIAASLVWFMARGGAAANWQRRGGRQHRDHWCTDHRWPGSSSSDLIALGSDARRFGTAFVSRPRQVA
jgi:small multidrug resistance family-3 protein